MPFTDIAVAIRDLVHVLHDHLPRPASGGLFSERSGIVNIGLEGLMIIGTVTGAFGARFFTDTVGLGTVWGPILGLLLRALCGADLRQRARGPRRSRSGSDHIVSGVVINLVADRLKRGSCPTRSSTDRSTQSNPGEPPPGTGWTSPVVVLAGRSLIDAFQDLSPMVVVAVLMVIPVSYSLYRTRWGFRLRSCGENPEATAVARRQRAAVPLRRACCCPARSPGCRARSSASEVIGSWREGQTLGLGFIALAALIIVELEPDPADVLRVAVLGSRIAIPLRLQRRAGHLAAAPSSSSG